MKKIWILVFPVVLLACHSMPIEGKWYREEKFSIAFKGNGTFQTHYEFKKDSILENEGKYSIESDSILTLRGDKAVKDEKYYFKVKDSILLFIYIENTENKIRLDSGYFHRNPKYFEYHIEQLYKYGEIRDTNRTKYPFIYFQF